MTPREKGWVGKRVLLEGGGGRRSRRGGVRENGDPSRKGEIETNTGKSYANIILMCIYIYEYIVHFQAKKDTYVFNCRKKLSSKSFSNENVGQ
jgi:hypothetical protein